MQTHFLQSRPWKEFQITLGRTILEGSGEGWSYLAMVEHDRFGTFVYAPYGPSARDQAALEAAMEDLKQQAKLLGAYVVIVEPYLPIDAATARRVLKHKAEYRQPEATQLIDLTKSEDDIIAGMNATRRKQFRNYHKKGITLEKSTSLDDIEIFIDLLESSSKKKGFFIRDREFFRTMAQTLIKDGHANLFIARFENTPIIAALTYEDAERRYYSYMGRNYNYEYLQANGPLLGFMIMDAKREGKKVFDLVGIALDDDPKNPWYGFTKFKRTLGGYPQQLAGTWEEPISYPRYWLRTLAHRLKK